MWCLAGAKISVSDIWLMCGGELFVWPVEFWWSWQEVLRWETGHWREDDSQSINISRLLLPALPQSNQHKPSYFWILSGEISTEILRSWVLGHLLIPQWNCKADYIKVFWTSVYLMSIVKYLILFSWDQINVDCYKFLLISRLLNEVITWYMVICIHYEYVLHRFIYLIFNEFEYFVVDWLLMYWQVLHSLQSHTATICWGN